MFTMVHTHMTQRFGPNGRGLKFWQYVLIWLVLFPAICLAVYFVFVD